MKQYWQLVLDAAAKWGIPTEEVWSDAAKTIYAQSVYWFTFDLLVALLLAVAYGVFMVHAVRAYKDMEHHSAARDDHEVMMAVVTIAWVFVTIGMLVMASNALNGVISPELQLIKDTTRPIG